MQRSNLIVQEHVSIKKKSAELSVVVQLYPQN